MLFFTLSYPFPYYHPIPFPTITPCLSLLSSHPFPYYHHILSLLSPHRFPYYDPIPFPTIIPFLSVLSSHAFPWNAPPFSFLLVSFYSTRKSITFLRTPSTG